LIIKIIFIMKYSLAVMLLVGAISTSQAV